MSPEEIAKNVRSRLSELAQALQEAGEAGLTVRWSIGTDNEKRVSVTEFEVLQTVVIAAE